MWRAVFLAIGFYLILLGVQCMGVQTFVLTIREPPGQREPGVLAKDPPKQGPKRVVQPPDWAPYSLMSTGAIVCLYSFTIPRRLRAG